jgi:DNA topoisomerase IB
MLDFARSLPDIRAKIAEHMGRRGLPREKVIATERPAKAPCQDLRSAHP